MTHVASLLSVCVLAMVHLYVGRLRLPEGTQRSAWLSAAGGAAAAYVFVYVLPKLAAKQHVLVQAIDTGLYGFLEHHAYLVALLGFSLYYGLHRAAVYVGTFPGHARPSDHSRRFALGCQTSGFAAYNILCGYLLVHPQKPGLIPLVMITLALALHFLSTDHGLRHHDVTVYDRVIGPVLAAATFVGWGYGMLTQLSDRTVALWFAFLAGAIVINVVKEELPSEQHSRFWPFLAGMLAYTSLVIVIETLPK